MEGLQDPGDNRCRVMDGSLPCDSSGRRHGSVKLAWTTAV
jgi:hypothetical protein